MKIFAKLMLSLVIIIAILGCTSEKDIESAKLEADNFHKLINAGSYSEIYKNMATGFKDNNTEARFTQFMSSIKEKFGEYKEIKFLKWQAHTAKYLDKSYTGVVLTFDVKYDNSHGVETIRLVNENGVMRISGYNIQSDDVF